VSAPIVEKCGIKVWWLAHAHAHNIRQPEQKARPPAPPLLTSQCQLMLVTTT
jgi:hypothetical protein